MFVDRVKVKVRGGNGGRGCSSFRREKFIPKGGPDGGDGGNGGSVVFEATMHEQNLNALRYLSHYKGGTGQHGMGKGRHGKNGGHKVIKVPIGTMVKDLELDGEVIYDLDHEGDRFDAAKGGRGGRGNTHFSTSTNRAPRRADDGTEGEEHEYELELKIIADIGLVGYPNAGKSTLLECVTNAKPEIAPYPFTTLTPNVGLIECDDYYRMTMADIPGLIDGAHNNVGLGHDFLRHIERTKVLVFVLDLAGTDGREPSDDLAHLQKELELYQDGLSKRTAVIAANKNDEGVAADKLAELRELTDLEIFPICAILGDGCDELLGRLREMVECEGKK